MEKSCTQINKVEQAIVANDEQLETVHRLKVYVHLDMFSFHYDLHPDLVVAHF